MNLEEIKKKQHLRPSTGVRATVLREQLMSFQRDLEGHIANLERVASWEDRNGPLPSEETALMAVQHLNNERRSDTDPDMLIAHKILGLIRGQAHSERCIDELVHTIEKTQQMLGEAVGSMED